MKTTMNEKNEKKSANPVSAPSTLVGSFDSKVETPTPSGIIAYDVYIAKKVKRTSDKGNTYYTLSIAVTGSGTLECYVDKSIYDNPEIVPGVVLDLTCGLNRGQLSVVGLYPFPTKSNDK